MPVRDARDNRDDFGFWISACHEPFDPELTAERLSRIDWGFNFK